MSFILIAPLTKRFHYSCLDKFPKTMSKFKKKRIFVLFCSATIKCIFEGTQGSNTIGLYFHLQRELDSCNKKNSDQPGITPLTTSMSPFAESSSMSRSQNKNKEGWKDS